LSDSGAQTPAAAQVLLPPSGWRRIGVLGGSFDPPHRAHRALADLALQVLGLDVMLWVPAGQPWQKAGRRLADAHHRLEMVRLIAAGQPRFLIDPRELRRTGPTYTVDTVRELAAEHPQAELFLVLGQDQYGRFDTWRDWHEILQRVTLAVAGRDGRPPEAPPALREVAHAVRELPLPDLPVASTALREAAAQGLPVLPDVGEALAGYIAAHHLYVPKEGVTH
jgi:nicotinate-nucleotide adenylyltransferase